MNLLKISLFAIFMILVFVACSDETTKSNTLSNDELYKNAIIDAMTADSSEISNKLISINEANNYLQWKIVNGKKYVLAVTFTPYSSSYIVGDTIQTKWGETWVTVIPEMKDFFKNYTFTSDSSLQLRMQQLLGLPAKNTQQWLIEFWVNPDSLFRPSADNEITDNIASLDFPQSTSVEYKTWFNNNILYSYFPSTGKIKYPWTRLGYTYDWANGANEQGLSEFVVKKETPIIVLSKKSPAEYIK